MDNNQKITNMHVHKNVHVFVLVTRAFKGHIQSALGTETERTLIVIQSPNYIET